MVDGALGIAPEERVDRHGQERLRAERPGRDVRLDGVDAIGGAAGEQRVPQLQHLVVGRSRRPAVAREPGPEVVEHGPGSTDSTGAKQDLGPREQERDLVERAVPRRPRRARGPHRLSVSTQRAERVRQREPGLARLVGVSARVGVRGEGGRVGGERVELAPDSSRSSLRRRTTPASATERPD